ncbi:hypothetical protein MCETRH20_01563 [Methylophilaceae bacterium]
MGGEMLSASRRLFIASADIESRLKRLFYVASVVAVKALLICQARYVSQF